MAGPTKNLRKIYKFARQAENLSSINIRIGLLGGKKVIQATKKAIGADPISSVAELPDMSFAGAFNLLIVGVKDKKDLLEKAGFLRKASSPVIVVIENSEGVGDDKALDKIEQIIDLNNLLFLGEGDFDARLKNAIIRELYDKRLAIGRVLPTFRAEIASEIISTTSNQNALVGIAVFLPGADMPILTLNQMKMILELAAVHNKSMNVERVKELLVTLGSGYVFRGLARQLLAFIPGPGFIVKGIVAYGGTQSIGQAAIQYFTRGAFPLESRNKSSD